MLKSHKNKPLTNHQPEKTSVSRKNRSEERDFSLSDLFRLKPNIRLGLKNLGLEKISDLLFYFPTRYLNPATFTSFLDAPVGQLVELQGTITHTSAAKTWHKKMAVTRATLSEPRGNLGLIFFHQPYLAKTYPTGTKVIAIGKISVGKNGKYLANPQLTKVEESAELPNSLFGENQKEAELLAIYKETKGVSSSLLRSYLNKIFQKKQHLFLPDPIPEEILKKYHLPTLASALLFLHKPRTLPEATAARKRFSFAEIFLLSLSQANEKKETHELKSFQIKSEAKEILGFMREKSGHTLTKAQEKCTLEALADMQKAYPMTRLLEGDVGSGKTLVAAGLIEAVRKQRASGTASLQVAILAPTETLARQHFQTFCHYFPKENIGLLLGGNSLRYPAKIKSEKFAKLSQYALRQEIADGRLSLIIGTHALLTEKTIFGHLALVIIDEQHRFGLNQRSILAKTKSSHQISPHLLSMTATPIPRTLALAIYGNLSLSVIDEMPVGRREIETKILPEKERAEAYTAIKEAVGRGEQVYIICPRIDEPDQDKQNALNATAAEKEAQRLEQEVFPDLTIGLMHGKMKKEDRAFVMEEFAKGKINLLVATSVIEVGVNVPNATVMIIEGADRFGLAQLHQLRGRVGRSEKESKCFLIINDLKNSSLERLRALKKAKNGFELAELDLTLRGPGTLGEGAQWGVTDMAMEALANLKLVTLAKEEASAIIVQDPDLKNYPQLKQAIRRYERTHLE